MRISSISNTTNFRAKIDSQNPLVSGNWDYLENPNKPAQVQNEPKKGSFWSKAFWTVVVLGAIAGAFAWGKGTKAVKDVMASGNTFKDLTGIGNKAKYIVGVAGDYVQKGGNNSVGKLVS